MQAVQLLISSKIFLYYNISPIESAKKGELSFLENMKYLDSANLSKATAIIVPNKIINKL